MNTLRRLQHLAYVNYNIYRWNTNTKLPNASHFCIAIENVASQHLCFTAHCSKRLCTSTNKEADIFGTSGHENYEVFEMNENEFEENVEIDKRPPRHRFKSIRQEYISKIRECVKVHDLQSALKYFVEMKEKHIHLRADVYNTVLYGLARQGNLKMCFSLYNEMKKRGIQPKPSTYVTLINACALRSNEYTPSKALTYLHKLQESMHENNVVLNKSHYHVLIKAYCCNHQILEAFRVADEMKDKNIKFTPVTYGSIMLCALGDKRNGLRLALGIWHQMRKDGVKPNTRVYNTFLRCIQHANVGKLQLNEPLIPGHNNLAVIADTNVLIPDLLASPPVINPLLLSAIQKKSTEQTKSIVSNVTQNEYVESGDGVLSEIIAQNRLILFGGAKSILKKMNDDGAVPDQTTLTILLELSAPSSTAENEIVKYARNKQIKVDTFFFNVLIKRRVLRNDYESAKAVLSYMEQIDLRPDIVTFGTLAKGCSKKEEYEEFISGMRMMGYTPNIPIISCFIFIAIRQKDFASLDMLFKYMIDSRMKINPKLLMEMNQSISFLMKDVTRDIKSQPDARKLQQKKMEGFLASYNKYKATVPPSEIITTNLFNEALDSRKSLNSKHKRE